MTPRPPQNAKEEAALARYWQARLRFERVLRKTPPELLGLQDGWGLESVEQQLASIDLPGLERPKPRPRVVASK